MLPLSNPWPDKKPSVPPDSHGWFSDKRAHALKKLIKARNAKTILEIGAWLGQSTRFFATYAHVVTVDSWIGSPNHWERPELIPKLMTLYDTFLVNCWDQRDKIWPLRVASPTALVYLAQQKISFDLVFIDGNHEYDAVRRDITLSRKLAGSPLICGDDWQNAGVNRAVREIFGEPKVEDRVWWS